jgi:hypothetical protein
MALKLPKVNEKERKLIRNAAFWTPGIHYGDSWYPQGTRQYTILKAIKDKLR